MSNGSSREDRWYWMKFNPNDWWQEPGLRAATLATRGVWIDVLCIMWKSPRKGVLELPNGCSPDAPQMARILGCSEQEWSTAQAELYGLAIADKSPDGRMICRRMVREAKQQQAASEKASKGGKAKAERAKGLLNPALREAEKPRSRESESQEDKKKDLGIGRDGQEPTRPDKDLSASPSNPKAEENDRAVKVRNWFAVCYRKINKADLPGFDPDDRRMSVQDRNACKAIYAMYGNGRAGKPGYVNQDELRRRLYHALAGNYYKLRPPANVAEFKRILPNCVDSALRPTDQRKSIPHVPDRPKVNETPGAERKFYADPDPWEEVPE